MDNLLRRRAITRAGRSEHLGKVAVCGELIGAGLGTALALTECRIGQPGVVAAAVNNPIVDWTSLNKNSSMDPKKSRRKLSKQKASIPDSALRELISLRTQLFTKPEHYFDPFASPVLFFRSAGIDVPNLMSLDEMDQLSISEREDLERQESIVRNTLSGASAEQDIWEDQGGERKRKASRRFPSKSSGLRLPPFCISAGSSTILNEQAIEISHLLRQSFARESKHAIESSEFGRKVLLEEEEDVMDEDRRLARRLSMAEAEEKVQISHHDGLGLWDDSVAGRARVAEVGRWLKDKFG